MPTQVVAPSVPWSRRGRPSSADALLIHATAIYEATIHERCGHPFEVCSDEAHEGRFHVEPVRCYATAALEDYADTHRDALPKDGSYTLTSRLLAEGEEVADPLRFDPAKAREAWLAQRRKYGLDRTEGGGVNDG
mgnify:FL=1